MSISAPNKSSSRWWQATHQQLSTLLAVIMPIKISVNNTLRFIVCKLEFFMDISKKIFFINVWRKHVFDIHFTEFGAVMTTVLPVLFKYCYTYCYTIDMIFQFCG
jgi:hypothetical protein